MLNIPINSKTTVIDKIKVKPISEFRKLNKKFGGISHSMRLYGIPDKFIALDSIDSISRWSFRSGIKDMINIQTIKPISSWRSVNKWNYIFRR